MNNGPWISTDMQARIKPPPITLVRLDLEDEHEIHIIRVKILGNPHRQRQRYKILTCLCSMVSNQKSYSRPSRISRLQLMEMARLPHQSELSISVVCYGENP